MREKLPKIFLVLVLALVLVNLGYFDYKLFFAKTAKTEQEIELSQDKTKQDSSSGCSTHCQQLIDQKINEALSKIPTQKPEKIVASVGLTSQPKVSYIPLVTEATINSADWKDITPSDFYFDLSDYSGAKNVRFEVYLKSQYQAGKVYVRLYDVTNKRGVDYSDLSSSSETYELQRSSDLTIWRGNNLYRLQGKTSSGIEGYLKETKLKIVQ